jgi:hypothetical protein
LPLRKQAFSAGRLRRFVFHDAGIDDLVGRRIIVVDLKQVFGLVGIVGFDLDLIGVNHAITGVCRLDHFIGLLDQLLGRPLAVIEFLERDFRRRHVATAAIGAGNGRAVQIIERRAAILALAMPFDAAASRQGSDTFQRCLQQFSTFCWRAKPWAARFQLIESMREQIPAPAAST